MLEAHSSHLKSAFFRMRRDRSSKGAITRAVGCGAALVLVAQAVSAQVSERVDQTTGGVQANLRSVCSANCVSQDGRLVVFSSVATNLTPHTYLGAFQNVFTKDRVTGDVALVSCGVGGSGNDAANAPSKSAVISADGNTIAFESAASNLAVAGQPGTGFEVIAYDRATDVMQVVPAVPATPFDNEYEPAISADGRYIAFRGNYNGSNDIYVWDRSAASVTLISVTASGAAAGNSWRPSISADGQFIAFESSSPALGALRSQIFVRDVANQVTTMISTAQGQPGVPANLDSTEARISADARFVAFSTASTDIAAEGEGILVFDRVAGTFQHASLDLLGTTGVSANAPSLSATGRFVGYISHSDQLVAGDSNGAPDVFVHDLASGTRVIATLRNDGAQVFERYVQDVSICGPENLVVFDSDATNLITPDANNNWQDVFARENPLTPLAFTVYCTAGTTTHGCVPWIWALGEPSVSAGSSFEILTSSVEGGKSGLIFYGITGAIGHPWTPNSWSFSCVKAPKQRTELRFSGGTTNACDGVIETDWLAFLAANPTALGTPFSAGTDVWAQAWFRDPPSPGKTNLSNGLHFVTTP